MDYYAIGQRIRKYRKAHGYSQEELAERVGISTTHMSHIETGNTKLSLPVLVLISEILEVRCDDLIHDREADGFQNGAEGIARELRGCSAAELRVIEDMVRALRVSICKHLKGK